MLLHLPALINMYVFSISSNIAKAQYNLVKMDFGWLNLVLQNEWRLFFNFYYIGYTLACLGLIWHWKQKSSNLDTRKQANLIFFSFFAALLLGSITDGVLRSGFLIVPLPQMAPIFILIPVTAIYYSVRCCSLIQDRIGNGYEIILNTETRARLYYHLSKTFLAAGLLSFLSYFLSYMLVDEEILKTLLGISGILFVLGIIIFLLRFINNEKIKGFLIMLVALLSIPIITLSFLEYAGVTVWAFPIILMIISLVFCTQAPLILLTSMAIITQILVWIHVPGKIVQVDKFDYIIRIGLLTIAFATGSIINRIYTKKLSENACQINFQKMISEISFDFVKVNQKNINVKINNMLKKIGEFFLVDRIYIFLFNHQDNTMTCTHEWYNEGINPETSDFQDLPLDALPWLIEQLKKLKLVYIEDVNRLPEEASAEKTLLTRQNIKSVITIPIVENGQLLGFMGFDSVTSFKIWTDYHIELLKIFSNMLADGLIKIKSEIEIEFLAYYDQLTGLPNRTLFSDRLYQAIQLAKRTENFVGVIFMDLDSFKMVNDTLGHGGGDIIIKEVAQGLVKRLRKTDTIARFGGDEFLIMLNSIPNNRNIIKIVDNIMELFSEPFNLNGREFYITASAGVAIYPMDGQDAETLIKNADLAMYRAKAKGKSQYVLCTTNMKEEVKKNMILSNSLYRAQERNELAVYYQPQINLPSGRITGVEALLRWRHPQMGNVPPNVFIPLAEKNGLINSIGEWVLRTASIQNKKWQDMGLPPLRMAVNLSIVQFNNPKIVDNVGKILKETNLDPRYLELEITEGIAIKEVNYTTGILNKLKKLGITISIDDFGTEYSSLSRLKTLPIDRIKIDMQFIQGLEGSEKDQAITKVIITLAKNLGLKVLAEGVETAPQLEFLNQRMCDEVQGFYCYKPMPAEEIEKLLRSSSNLKEMDVNVVE